MHAEHPVIEVRGLVRKFKRTDAVDGLNLKVEPGRCYGFFARNGAGKTTTLRSVVGLIERRDGDIRIDGRSTQGLTPEEIAHLGVAYCPEERGIFASLTVQENLLLPPVLLPGGMSVEEIHVLFPNLKARSKSSGGKLSGGEQQMLAIARILRTGARLLLLDEPTEGLAPVIVKKIGEAIKTLRERGFTILMVEQNFRFAAPLADRFLVMEHGQVIQEFTQAELPQRINQLHEALGV